MDNEDRKVASRLLAKALAYKDCGIKRFTMETAKGNTLQFFYNPDNNLVVVDLIAVNEQGGIELLRKTLNEDRLFAHTIEKAGDR